MSEAFDLSLTIESALMQGATRNVVEQSISREAEKAGLPMPAVADIDRAYAACVERWVADTEREPATIHAYHVRLRKHLYQRSYAVNDFKTCLAIAADLAKLQTNFAESQRRL